MRFSVIAALALVHRESLAAIVLVGFRLTAGLSVLLVAAAAYLPGTDSDSEFATDGVDVETSVGSLTTRRSTLAIGQRCSSDSQYASACCGFNTAKCAGAVVAQLLDGGCGHGDAHPKHKLRNLD